jgi:hypothetical protein
MRNERCREHRLGTTAKYLRGATDIGLRTTIKYLRRTTRKRPRHHDQVPATHNERRRRRRRLTNKLAEALLFVLEGIHLLEFEKLFLNILSAPFSLFVSSRQL